MISIKGLSKTYDTGNKALDSMDLKVEDGEILALLGPNGAGKSTAIRILTTLSGFDEGSVNVAGINVDENPDGVRGAIGYVAQETGVDFFLTGRENLMLQGRLYRMKKPDILARIEQLAAYFEIDKNLDTTVAAYSGGMRRKLDIATALIHQPKVLFLDEPTLGLDTQSRQSLWKYIAKLQDEFGLTILLTTHYLDEADKLANRVAIINQGQIKVIDTPEALKSGIHGDVVSLEFDTVDKNTQSFTWGLKSTDYVKDTTWEGERFHIYVDNGASAIPKIMEQATQQSIVINNISFSRPTLDDVFIKYTGSSLNADKEESGEQWWEKWAGKGNSGTGKWAKQWQQNNEDESTDQTASGSDAKPNNDADGASWQQWENNAEQKPEVEQPKTEPSVETKPAEQTNNPWPSDPSQWQDSAKESSPDQTEGENKWPKDANWSDKKNWSDK